MMNSTPPELTTAEQEGFATDMTVECGTDMGADLATVPLHIVLLRTEYMRRKERNPRYSVRAFARSMGMHASAMCRTLRGKADLSVRASFQIISRMDLSEEERRAFVASVANEKARRILSALRPAVRREQVELARGAELASAGGLI